MNLINHGFKDMYRLWGDIIEEYSPGPGSIILVTRTYVLRVTTLMTLFFLHLEPLRCRALDDNFCVSCAHGCWETELGRFFYRLQFCDLTFYVFYFFISKPLKKAIILNKLTPKTQPKTQLFLRSFFSVNFEINISMVEIMYTLCTGWMGLFYAPGNMILMIVQILVFFYGKRYQLRSMKDVRNRADAFKMARTAGFWAILWIVNFVFAAGFA